MNNFVKSVKILTKSGNSIVGHIFML